MVPIMRTLIERNEGKGTIEVVTLIGLEIEAKAFLLESKRCCLLMKWTNLLIKMFVQSAQIPSQSEGVLENKKSTLTHVGLLELPFVLSLLNDSLVLG